MTPRPPHFAAALLVALALPALAQQAPPPAPAPKEHPASAQPAPAAPPSLDELLGITPDKPTPKERPAALDPTRAELDRKLTARDAAEQFKQAVDLMGQTAERLQASKDTGLATQRLQEDILRKLDMVIHSAEQQQQQSSSRPKPKPQQQNEPQSQQRQQQTQRQDSGRDPAPDTIDPPARRDGPLNPELAARGAAWGALPERVRESLMQGNADKYSSLYQRWTEAYYRKLAEEDRK